MDPTDGCSAGATGRAILRATLCAILCLAAVAAASPRRATGTDPREGPASQTQAPGQAPPASADASLPTNPRFASLRRWLEAVERHKPGMADDSAFAVAWYERRDLGAVLDELVRLTDRMADATVMARVLGSGDQTRVSYAGATISVQEMRAVLGLSADEIARRDPSRILKRGAVLHADVAMLSVRVADLPQPLPSSGQAAVMLARDGRGEGFDAANVHWAFGRALLDRVKPAPAQDPMVQLWYQAAAAFMHYHSKFGDLVFHLDPARRLFPADADILFSSGALHESFASAAVQSVARTMVVQRGARPGVLAATFELQLAERFFAQALKRNPELIEARLRRARVLGLQGHHSEAAALLRQVLEATRDSLLRVLRRAVSRRGGTDPRKPRGRAGCVRAGRGHLPRGAVAAPGAEPARARVRRSGGSARRAVPCRFRDTYAAYRRRSVVDVQTRRPVAA